MTEKNKVKQQGNGSGSEYPRKDKDGKSTSYLGAYYADGKKRYVSAKTKSECRDNLRAVMSDAEKGLVYDAGSTTVGAYLDKWLPGIRARYANARGSGTSSLSGSTSSPRWVRRSQKTSPVGT